MRVRRWGVGDKGGGNEGKEVGTREVGMIVGRVGRWGRGRWDKDMEVETRELGIREVLTREMRMRVWR